MKRLSLILGRIGTATLAICLALFILTLIPSASFGISRSGEASLRSETYFVGGFFTLNPQILLKININANATLKFYILKLNYSEALENLQTGNFTQFKDFIEENPDKVLFEKVVIGNVTVQYTPEGIFTVCIVLVNEGTYNAWIEYEAEPLATIAPAARIIMVITYLAPIGAVLSGQWILLKLKNRGSEKFS